MKHPSDLLRTEITIENYTLKNFTTLTSEELEIVRGLRNLPDIRKWMFSDHDISYQEHLNFIHSLQNDKKNLYYLIFCENLPYGVIYFNRIDLKNRHAFLGLYANPENKSKNTGSNLGRLILKIAFEHLKLHSLKLEVIENNHRAINLYRKLGFKEEGRLKEFVYKEGKWYDVIVMGMTEEEYFENETKN